MISFVDSTSHPLSPSVVCLGFFDGVHLGHQAIIKKGRELASTHNLILCVHTYDIPPMQLIKPNEQIKLLTSLEEKADLLQQMGVDVVAVSRFDETLMRQSGDMFFQQVLLNKLSAQHIVAGDDHRFGWGGKTDIHALQALCDEHGIGLSVVPAVTTEFGQAISSSAIRDALLAGNTALAEQMLGRSR